MHTSKLGHITFYLEKSNNSKRHFKTYSGDKYKKYKTRKPEDINAHVYLNDHAQKSESTNLAPGGGSEGR